MWKRKNLLSISSWAKQLYRVTTFVFFIVFVGVVFCVGGRGASGDPFKTIECYDLRRDRWFQVTEMSTRRRHVGVVSVNGQWQNSFLWYGCLVLSDFCVPFFANDILPLLYYENVFNILVKTLEQVSVVFVRRKVVCDRRARWNRSS